MHYLFIDESGDSGEFGSKYFIIAGIAMAHAHLAAHLIKRVREGKLGKKLKEVPELKASKSSEELRKEILSRINRGTFEVHLLILQKNAITISPQQLAEAVHLLHSCAKPAEIIVDKQDKRTTELIELLPFLVKTANSRQHAGLQLADFVAWSVYRAWERGDFSALNVIRDKIKTTIELKKTRTPEPT